MPPSQLPRFWIFMYHLSPLTYLMEGLAVAGLSEAHLRCSDIETLRIPLPSLGGAITCDEYLQPYVQTFGGYVANTSNATDCQYCPVSIVNTLLVGFGMDVKHTWRNVGLLVVYVCFNISATFGVFWVKRRFKRL